MNTVNIRIIRLVSVFARGQHIYAVNTVFIIQYH
jgi:hypothetical protein